MKFASNPLAGMNPWLEGSGGDFNTSMTTYACDAIQHQLPGDLVARIVEYESAVVPAHTEPQTLRYIQILDTKAGRRVITAIEFLSLANKATEAGRRQYFAKQNELLDAGVNLVEIDLLRSGKWVLAARYRRGMHRYPHPPGAAGEGRS